MGGRRRARGAYQSPGPCERSELDMGWSMHMGHGVALTHELPQVRLLSDYRDPMGLHNPVCPTVLLFMALYTFVLNCLGEQRDPSR